MELNEIQQQHREWQLRNFGEHPAWHPLLGVGEEVGELQHAFLKREQGIRGTKEEHDAAIRDAVADILIYLCDFCNCEKIDMLEELNKTWLEVSKRDWKKNSVNGSAPPS